MANYKFRHVSLIADLIRARANATVEFHMTQCDGYEDGASVEMRREEGGTYTLEFLSCGPDIAAMYDPLSGRWIAPNKLVGPLGGREKENKCAEAFLRRLWKELDVEVVIVQEEHWETMTDAITEGLGIAGGILRIGEENE